MSNILVYNTSFTDFSLDLAKDYYIFSYQNSIFKLKDCIFNNFDQNRSEKARCFIIFTEKLCQVSVENIKTNNSTLNLVQALYQNRVMFQNLNISLHSDSFVIGLISQFRSSFIFFKNCTFYLLEKTSFQNEGNVLVFKNNKIMKTFQDPSTFLWNNIINCTIVIKHCFSIVLILLFL